MNKISNVHDLNAEKQRLNQRISLLKREIDMEVREIKNKLQPLTKLMNLLGDGFTSVTEASQRNPLVSMGARLGIDMLIGPRLAKAGWLAKVLVPPLLRGISKGVLSKVADKWKQWRDNRK